MGSFKVLNQRVIRLATLAALVTATLVQGLVPVLASAAQVTERSIGLSSSSKGATNVSYKIKFKSVSAAGAFAVFFCNNTPLIGETCTPPADFDATSGASSTSGFTDVTSPSANKLVVTGTIGAATNIEVDVTGIENPSVEGTLYARIVTYDTKAHATSELDNGVDAIDGGSVAIAINNSVGVSGAVLETMTFCVAGQVISPDCDLTGNTLPSLKLGKNTAGVIALDSADVYSGSIYTQISTNAVGGAVINLKSNALNCGGLIRAGAPSACDIAPAVADSILAGQAKFGVMTDADSTTADGTIQAVGSYNDAGYYMGFTSGNSLGVTSVYGDSILDTNNLPANNKNMKLTFGASVANNTPAGNYSADLSLVATGKF